jgi:hypothetical protein
MDPQFSFSPFHFQNQGIEVFLLLEIKENVSVERTCLGNAAIEGIFGVIMGCEKFIRFLGFVR